MTQKQMSEGKKEGRATGQMAGGVSSLIASAMPRTASMVKDWRRTMGDAHVTECVRRGLAGEAGWFFAREGAVAVGTPWGDDTDVLKLFGMQAQGGAFVMMRTLDGEGACVQAGPTQGGRCADPA
jgi:hypothetical protein